jgi:hypothetical protein
VTTMPHDMTSGARARRRFVTRFAKRLAAVCAIVAAAAALQAREAWSHPLHTTLTDIALDSTDGSMRLTIRAFIDDFSAVVARHAGKPRPADYSVAAADVESYVADAVTVDGADGRRAAISWGGMKRTGDLVWVTVRVPSVRSLRGVKLTSALLFEVFNDQVNIVQTVRDGHRHSMLFTAGDGRAMKAIP